jgi:hypothetical protein
LPNPDDKPAKKKKIGEPLVQEEEENETTDEEILNAVNQYQDSISLSIYDDKNIRKRKF